MFQWDPHRPEQVAEEEDGAGDEGEEGGGEGEHAGEDYRVTEVSGVIHDVTSLKMSASGDPIMTLHGQRSILKWVAFFISRMFIGCTASTNWKPLIILFFNIN